MTLHQCSDINSASNAANENWKHYNFDANLPLCSLHHSNMQCHLHSSTIQLHTGTKL